MRIDAHFDAGNIECLDSTNPQNIRLKIRKDVNASFFQWFYFRLSGAAGIPCRLVIENANESAYSKGWNGYKARHSNDGVKWFLTDTDYDGQNLTISITPQKDIVYFAYFAPFSQEQHRLLINRMVAKGCRYEGIGSTLDGRSIDLLRFGTPQAHKMSCWVIARQHPGETMAEWWMQGFLERLANASDPIAKALLDKAVVYLVPNMNPDGSFRGHLRTNAAGANLNREWENPTLEHAPEVYWVRKKMRQTGVDFCLDVHGDEEIPYNFVAGSEGIPSFTTRIAKLQGLFTDILKRTSPDFQTEYGYPVDPAGEGNMTMCTNHVSEYFDCLALTLEQPFKDVASAPDPQTGWSPSRAECFGAACVGALLEICEHLR